SGSYARAGAVTACYVLGTAVGTPVLGRVADTAGRRPVLVTAGAANAVGLASLALVPLHYELVLYVVAAASGACLPPVAPAVRSLWRGLAPAGQTSSLYAIDATLQEITFMVGPALVALLSSLASASTALIVSGVIGLGGTVAVTSHPATATRPAQRDAPGPALSERPKARTPALAVLSVMTALFLTSIASVEVTVVAFAGHHHRADMAGVLLVVWSAGSLVGGLSFGARMAHAGPRAIAPLMLAAAAGFAALALAPGITILYPLLFAAGTAIAPGFSLIYDVVGRTTPPAVSVEAFSWISSAIQLGASAGAAMGGVLVEATGTSLSFVIAGGIGIFTTFVATAGSRLLVRAVKRPVPLTCD
ncbi:MAG: MFS transporter, partial [Acidimicrobiales bacterium]